MKMLRIKINSRWIRLLRYASCSLDEQLFSLEIIRG